MARKIMIIAGEASGDLHGGNLVKALRQREPDVEIFGVGGDRMQAAGMQLFYHVQDLAYVGFSEIIKHLPHFYRVFHDLVDIALESQPDVVVLIDYPGFNLRIGKKLKSHGFKIFYFIAPQVWAWHQSRAKKMAFFIDRMAVMFDFEVDFFSKYGIDAHHVGHPLVDGLKTQKTRDQFLHDFNLRADSPILALLPGSRKQEIENLLPDMLKAADLLKQQHPQLQIAVGLAETIKRDWLSSFLVTYPQVRIVTHATYELMSYSTAGIVASGTATLETACFGLPFVLMYRVSLLSFIIGKKVVKIPHIGLVNIVARAEIVREFVQDNIKPNAMADELEKCLFDVDYRDKQKAQLSFVREKLGQPGAAIKTAKLVLKLIGASQHE